MSELSTYFKDRDVDIILVSLNNIDIKIHLLIHNLSAINQRNYYKLKTRTLETRINGMIILAFVWQNILQ